MKTMMQHSSVRRFGVFIAALVLLLSARAGANAYAPPGGAGRNQDGPRSSRRPARDDKAPKAGEVAPAFKLATLDGKRQVSLESFRGKRPVILFFGSYT